MKSAIILLLSLTIGYIAATQGFTSFIIPVKNWNLKILGLDNFYPTYLADPLGARFEISSQTLYYGDIDMQDEINSGGRYLGKLVAFPSCRGSFLKFSPKSNPNIGIDFDMGLT